MHRIKINAGCRHRLFISVCKRLIIFLIFEGAEGSVQLVEGFYVALLFGEKQTKIVEFGGFGTVAQINIKLGGMVISRQVLRVIGQQPLEVMLRLSGIFRQVFYAERINIKRFTGFILNKLKKLLDPFLIHELIRKVVCMHTVLDDRV